MTKANTLFQHFSSLEDPRKQGMITHKLLDIVALALLSFICGAEGWDDVEEFGLAKYKWLATFLELPEGIPSQDTIARVFQRLDPRMFQACFMAWASSLTGSVEGKLIAIDGKMVRHSFDRASGQSALHMVRAWVQENQLVFGQIATDMKSNEITAIPQLLDVLDIKGAIVSIDAMGTQRAIAEKIVEKEADYLLALKGNQETIHTATIAYFEQVDAKTGRKPYTSVTSTETAHGRTETRRVCTSYDVASIAHLTEWPHLASVTRVERERKIGEKVEKEVCYYISSLSRNSKQQGARYIGSLIRKHWSIENQCHWQLDVSMREDESRIRKGHGQENLTMIRTAALHLLKHEKTSKRGIRGKQKKAGWDHDYLLSVLMQ
jgi:predicted transposase YbfD/YdcC